MADRLTQLQDTINQQAEHFCNSIGILQQFSTPSKFPGFDRTGSQTPQQGGVSQAPGGVVAQQAGLGPQQAGLGPQQAVVAGAGGQQEEYASVFAGLIARTARDIDTLIEALPSEESTVELQLHSLRRLEAENKEAAEHLEEVVRQGDVLVEKIQASLADIAHTTLTLNTIAHAHAHASAQAHTHTHTHAHTHHDTDTNMHAA